MQLVPLRPMLIGRLIFEDFLTVSLQLRTFLAPCVPLNHVYIMYSKATSLLLLITINIHVNLLIIKTNMTSNKSWLQGWVLVPPNQIFVLSAIYDNVVVFLKINDRGLAGLRIGPLTIRLAFIRASRCGVTFREVLPTCLGRQQINTREQQADGDFYGLLRLTEVCGM